MSMLKMVSLLPNPETDTIPFPELLEKDYMFLVNYFKEKYGNVPKDYFQEKSGLEIPKEYRSLTEYLLKDCDKKLNLNDSMKFLYNEIQNLTKTIKKTWGITRGTQGLFIHHIDEDKAIMLSSPAFALEHPFAYQKADRLVYVNLLEHLLLHIKIVEFAVQKNVGIGGAVNFIIPELNDYFSGYEPHQNKQKTVKGVIIHRKEDYFELLFHFLKVIEKTSDDVLSKNIYNSIFEKPSMAVLYGHGKNSKNGNLPREFAIGILERKDHKDSFVREMVIEILIH